MNFILSQDKCIYKIYKKLLYSSSMSEETRSYVKPVGTRPGIVYDSCKVNKNVTIVTHLFDQFYLSYNHVRTSLQSI